MPDGGFHNDPTALRLRLLAHGYKPVPIAGAHMRVKDAGKRPLIEDWPNVCAAADEAEVRRWTTAERNCTNTGILTGISGLVAPDIDVTNPDYAPRIVDMARAILGPTPFVRIGKAPKTLLLYRVPGEVKKLLTPELFGPHGDRAQVEVLALGQQFVAYGIHPDTRQPYAWPQRAPADALVSEVPETTLEALAAFVAAAESILCNAGYAEHKRGKKPPGANTKPQKTKPFGIDTNPEFPPPTREEVADALRAVPNTHDWEGWHKIGAAVFDALADDGEDLFLDWSAQSSKNDQEATKAKWRSYGTSPSTVKAATLFYEARQNGWKPERERLRQQVGNLPNAAANSAAPDDIELTEDGVALAFEEQNRDRLRYCHDTGGWYVWTGTHWQPNRDGLAFTWARDLVRTLNRTAEFKTKAITGKAAFAGSVEKFAQRARAFAVTAETWDRDPFLLGTPGGVVDLQTGQLRPASQDDYITKLTACAPAASADCPTWFAFLRQATAGDNNLVLFLQQWAGYCLTGSTREHALMFIYGDGGNGKGVFLNTVSRILGDYCSTAAMDTFISSQGDKHPTDLAMLRGARLVTASETEEGRAWAESRIKQMTGGDPVTARFMRQDFFTYTPQFKLMIAGNHKPALKNVDAAARRRFNIVPFMHKPETPDRQLENKLMAEAPGILRWMIEGCLDWQRSGLERPKIVTDATAEYFEAQDTIGRWLAERCILDPQLQEKPGTLLTDCKAWAGENGEAPPAAQQFRSALEKVRGVRYATVKGSQSVKGLGLKPTPDRRQGGEGGGGWR